VEEESPFFCNICFVEDLHECQGVSTVVQVMKELVTTVNDEQKEVANPFLLVGLVPRSRHLPKSVATAFSYHISIPTLPEKVPDGGNALFQTSEGFRTAMTRGVQMHKEVSIYLGRLVLKADCTPLVTSYIDVKTKLLLQKALEDCALLHGREFVIPDDVQAMFPYLITHRLLLPGPTTFQTCIEYAKSIIESIEVPV
jgi:hypothetical protein